MDWLCLSASGVCVSLSICVSVCQSLFLTINVMQSRVRNCSYILYLAIIEDTARPTTADKTIPADASEHTLNVTESNGSLTSKLSYEIVTTMHFVQT